MLSISNYKNQRVSDRVILSEIYTCIIYLGIEVKNVS